MRRNVHLRGGGGGYKLGLLTNNHRVIFFLFFFLWELGSVYSLRHCEIWVLNASHAHNLCAWLLIILSVTIMYYSNLQVNYMVTVFIR